MAHIRYKSRIAKDNNIIEGVRNYLFNFCKSCLEAFFIIQTQSRTYDWDFTHDFDVKTGRGWVCMKNPYSGSYLVIFTIEYYSIWGKKQGKTTKKSNEKSERTRLI